MLQVCPRINAPGAEAMIEPFRSSLVGASPPSPDPQARAGPVLKLRLSRYGYDLRLFRLTNSLILSACAGTRLMNQAVNPANLRTCALHHDEDGRLLHSSGPIPYGLGVGLGAAAGAAQHSTWICLGKEAPMPACGSSSTHAGRSEAGGATPPLEFSNSSGADLPHLCQRGICQAAVL